MEVIVSNNVKTALEKYRKSLKNYPISLERAHKKFSNMISALQALGTAISTPSVCMNKDLLQSFDSNGNPMNKNLKLSITRMKVVFNGHLLVCTITIMTLSPF